MGRTLMTAGIALQTQPFFLKILERKLMVNGVPCERGGCMALFDRPVVWVFMFIGNTISNGPYGGLPTNVVKWGNGINANLTSPQWNHLPASSNRSGSC